MRIGKDRRGASRLDQCLAHGGRRLTRQRQHVYRVLLERRDHPTAEEVFLRAKQGMPEISLATVYNSLEALVQCGLARPVHVDRSATRFCPNMREHFHFYCETCGRVFDVGQAGGGGTGVPVPRGFQPMHYEVSIRGICPGCNGGKSS